ncbi:MAG: 50S ribosomal protein L21, partial [Anaerolineales bacterium]|nr:50S ribosomal protein L21 [Anaerolineales bacterium]
NHKMRIAIVESGGKQYLAVEGSTIDVDRLATEVGKSFDFDRVMLMVDEDVVMVGTPTVDGIKVSATVVSHIKGPKVISFKYRPKKRIRVKGGHRHFYTRLMIDFIGKPGEERKVEVKKEAVAEVEAVAATEEVKVEKPKKTPAKKEAVKKPAAAKSPSKSSAAKKTDKK